MRGIFARHEAEGVAAPALFGTTTSEEVGRAVFTAIRCDTPEIIVTPRPIPPFLALAVLAPRTVQRLTSWAGVTAVARRVARLHERYGDPPTRGETTAGATPRRD